MERRTRATKDVGEPKVMAAGASQIYQEPHSVESDAMGDFDSSDEIAIVRRATEVLGLDHVAQWMQSRIPSLRNQTPYELIKTEVGRSDIERVLLKIEHGVY